MKIKLPIIFLLSIMAWLPISLSQEISKETIEGYVEDIDFDKKKEILVPKSFKRKEPKTREPKDPSPSITEGFGKMVEMIGYLFLALGVIFIIYRLSKDFSIEKKNKIKIDLDNIEDIQEVDLETLLKDALQQENYRLALRLEFLQVLKEMSIKDLINWKNYKTNRIYLQETKNSSWQPSFQYLVRLFEHFWYGKNHLSKAQYEAYQAHFISLKNELR